jgi:hypothetical protein
MPADAGKSNGTVSRSDAAFSDAEEDFRRSLRILRCEEDDLRAELSKAMVKLRHRDAYIAYLKIELAGAERRLRARGKYWGLAPIVHAPRDLLRLVRGKGKRGRRASPS